MPHPPRPATNSAGTSAGKRLGGVPVVSKNSASEKLPAKTRLSSRGLAAVSYAGRPLKTRAIADALRCQPLLLGRDLAGCRALLPNAQVSAAILLAIPVSFASPKKM
jgi:hypothetical protein